MIAIQTKEAYSILIAAIISRAIMDVQGRVLCMDTSETREALGRDEAMGWFHSPDFEAYALALEIDPQHIRNRAADYYRRSITDLLTPAEPPPPKVVSAETRAKISAALKGKPKSPEHKEKIRGAKLGTKQSPEHRAARGRGMMGKTRSPEVIEKLRAANMGRKMSDEARAKIREAQRARWDRPEERERARQNTRKRFSDPAERAKQAERTRAYAAKRKQ
ncbi:hypothetical protein FACS189493_7290 [Spirochaetia bacterium]|nr:hypothetical protein FACS189493_7290 [Spirochaetia bacterium]